MRINISPIGFQYKASAIFPWIRDNTDRVEPQEGQGIPVTCFIKQTPPMLFTSGDKFIFRYNQMYPAMHEKNKIP
jgi:hypothetical protein